MVLPDTLLPASWTLAAHVLLATLLALAAIRAPWRRFAENEQNHVWLGTVVCIALLWRISGSVGEAVRFHLLGATIAYLFFGGPLALLALAAAGAVLAFATGASWHAYSLHVLLSGALPVTVSGAVLAVAERRLPPNYFVYVFIGAFLGGVLSMVAAGAATAWLASIAAPGTRYAGEDLAALLLMLGFGEGTLTGMLVSLAVVYKPTWVSTFSDARYLARRDR